MEKRIVKEDLGMRLGKRPVTPLDRGMFHLEGILRTRDSHLLGTTQVPHREHSSLLICNLHHEDGEST